MIADRRISAFRRRLAEEKVGAFIVTSVPNVRYLTGFEGVFDDEANVACLVTPELVRVYTDFRYEEAAREAAEGTPWVVYAPEDSIYVHMVEDLTLQDVEEIALESSVAYGRFRFLSERFGGKVLVVEHWVESLRQVKEAAEIERIAAAAALTDETLAHVLGVVAPGVRERDIALEIEMYMRRAGADGVAFTPIVASGPNSSRPHAGVTDRALEVGDLLTIDLGARVDGYCSDCTRTVVLGSATDRQREVYEAVLAANLAALAAIRSGVPGADFDKIARDTLTERGLGVYFGHGLGHGVGLEVHEMPSLSQRWRDSIMAGSVVTVEPGVYIADFGGVRIEDLVVVEEAGCTVLSSAPKELLEL